MKLKIKKYVNNNRQSKAYGKTYGRIEHLETLNTLDVAKHIQKHGSVFTSDVIVGILQRFSLCLEELLQEGYKVKLNGLGTFYLSVKTIGEQDADDFGVSNIKQVSIQFLADKSKVYDWNSASQTARASFSFDSNGSGSSSDSGSATGDDSGDEPGEDRP